MATRSEEQALVERFRGGLPPPKLALCHHDQQVPHAPQARRAQELIDTLDQRIAELRLQQANTRPPGVTVVGAN